MIIQIKNHQKPLYLLGKMMILFYSNYGSRVIAYFNVKEND